MSDLISRQAAIDRAVSIPMFGRDVKMVAVGEIKNLPSAQPERLTDDDFETIRIHLNAYKEKLCNQQRWKEAEEYQRIIDRFMTFASAQTNLQPNCNELATDCISRQAVLDLIEMSMNDLEYDNENEELQYAVRSLPSAKLNFDMTTKIDKAYDDGYKAGYLQAKHDWGDKDE